MICPFCEAVNRDDRETCYHCSKDLSMLRLVVNKAKHHYNLGLEHAERQRYKEAVNEINNALELYSDFPSARVVLGTLYAKMEQYDLAQLEWEKALQLEPNLYKAYQYLEKAERAREAIPAIRRLRVLVWTFALVTLAAAVFVGFEIQSRLELKKLREASALFQEGDWGAARKKFHGLKRFGSSGVAEIAGAYNDLIARSFIISLQEIEADIASRQFAKARDLLEEARKRHPDDVTGERARVLEESLKEAAFDAWNDLEAKALKGAASLETVRKCAEELVADYPDDPRTEEVKEAVARIESSRAATVFDKILLEYQSSRNAPHARVQIQQLLKDNPGYKPAQELLDKIAKDEFDVLNRSFQDALASGNTGKAREFLAELRTMASGDGSGGWKERVEALNKDYLKALLKSETARLKALKLEDYVADQEVFNLPDEMKGQERDLLEALARQARQRVAQVGAEWMKKLDYRYQTFSISPEDAHSTLLLAPLVYENYGFKWSRPYVLFYAGVSYLKLGEGEQADKTFERLRKEYPDSSYLGKVKAVRDRAGQAAKAQVKPSSQHD